MGELQNFWCEIYLSPEAPVPGADWKPPERTSTDRITGFKTWDGRNDLGVLLPFGLFFYKLQAGSNSVIKKMTFLQ